MFGVINLKEEILPAGRKQDFIQMNAGIHHISNKPFIPVVENDLFIAHVSNENEILEDSNAVLFYKGRIFNQLELLVELELQEGTTSAEVLFKLHMAHGKDFIKYVTGEFSILILNKESKEITLFRDPLGVIPIYYAFANQCFYFSSELRRIGAISSLSKIDWDFIQIILSHKVPQNYDKTWFKRIKRLPPGNCLFIEEGSLTIYKYHYFQLVNTFNKDPLETVIKEFRSRLEVAVNRQINEEESVHAHFSGGLDSSGIAALAYENAKNRAVPFYTYACGLREDQRINPYEVQDERKLQFSVAKHIGMPTPEIVSFSDSISMEELNLPMILPKTNDLKTYLKETLVKIAKRKGRILLSGFGGDECITCNQYPLHLSHAFWSLKWSLFWKESKMYSWKRKLIYILESKKVFNKLFRLIKPSYTFISLGKKNNSQKVLLKNRVGKNLRKNIKKNSLNEEIISYLESPHVSYRIESEKEYASYYGVDLRYPFLDIELVNFFLSIPSEFKMLDGVGRKLYRKAIQKWIDYDPFLEASKSRVATVPIQLLRQNKSIAEQLLDYDGVMNTMPEKLKNLLKEIPKPKEYNSRLDQHFHRSYVLLAEISSFIKSYSPSNSIHE